MKEFLQATLIIVLALVLLPSALVLGIYTLVYGLIILPILAIGFLIWRAIKRHREAKPYEIPENAVLWTPKPKRKPIMIKYQGKDIPLGVFIFSVILSLTMVPILLICLFFVFPPVISACIIGFMTCRVAGGLVGRKEQHG
jgi:hypothetical protein